MKRFVTTGLVLSLFLFVGVAQAANEHIASLQINTVPNGTESATVEVGEAIALAVQALDNEGTATSTVGEKLVISLSDGLNGGVFTDGTVGGTCNPSLWSNSADGISATDTRKAFCYENSTAGAYIITATAGTLSATFEVVVEAAPSVTIEGGATYPTLQAAVDAADPNDTIVLNSDLTISSAVVIDIPVTIDGNGHTLFAPFAKTSNSNNAAIIIVSPDVTIRDLTEDGTGSASLHGINVFNSAGITLDNVMLKSNTSAGLIVNSSNVTANNLSTSGNVWYGVNVDKNSTGDAVFTLTGDGIIAEATQIITDKTVGATVVADGYTAYKVNGTTKTLWANKPISNAATITHEGVSTLYTTIQAAIDAATEGQTVNVGVGTYAELLTVNKGITITGAGDALDGTVISNSDSGVGITVSASNVTLRELRVDKGGVGSGIEVTGVDVNSLALDGITATNAVNGFRVGSGVTIDGLTVEDSHFDGNTHGWYLAKETAASADATVTDVSVSDTTFSNNTNKGIYAEKLSNAVFDGITVENSGTNSSYNFNNGIDINLKWSAYENIVIRNSTITGSGLAGPSSPFAPAGIAIKARDDAPSYASPAASLSNVTIENVIVSGGVVGIRFGEEGKNNLGPSGAVVTSSSLSGTGGIALANASQDTTIANANWWESAAPNFGTLVSGSVTIDTWYVDSLRSILSTETVNPDIEGNVTVTESTPNVVIISDSNPITIDASGVAEASIVLGALLEDGEGDIPQISVNSNVVDMEIPATTITSEDADWDGLLMLPTLTTAPAIELEGGQVGIAFLSIEVGSSETALSFDDPVKLTFAGQAGNQVGWSRDGEFEVVDDICDSLTDPDLGTDEDCKIDSGSDLVVWTRHFTTFVTYTVAREQSGGGSRTGASRAAERASVATVNVPAVAASGEVLGAFVGPEGEVLGAGTEAKIASIRAELISKISQLIVLLQTQLAAAIAAGR